MMHGQKNIKLGDVLLVVMFITIKCNSQEPTTNNYKTAINAYSLKL